MCRRSGSSAVLTGVADPASVPVCKCISRPGEGTTLRLNVPFHRAQAAAAAINKFATRECFRKAGLPVPEYSRIHVDEDSKAAANQVAYPCVLKPLGLSTSRGVIRANGPQEFIAA